MTPAKPARTRETYPWAELYNLESGAGRRPRARRTRRGRPPRPVPREKVTLELTDEERRVMREIQGALLPRLNSVSQGQVVGLALRLLEAKLLSLGKPLAIPTRVTDWIELLEVLTADR